MFCQQCHDNKMPQKGQLFLTLGADKKEVVLRKVTKNGHFGYTPHIITFDHVTKDGRIVVYKSCAMIGCGWEILKTNEEDADISCVKANVVYMEPLDYAALKKFKDESFYLD